MSAPEQNSGRSEFIKQTSNITRDNLQAWIWQRTHNLDKMSGLGDPTDTRDPNPEHALMEYYRNLSEPLDRQFFACTLITSATQSAQEVREHMDDPNVTPYTLSALDDHLIVLHRLQHEDLDLKTLVPLAESLNRLVYQELEPAQRPATLKQETLLIRTIAHVPITDDEFIERINDPDTMVVTMNCTTYLDPASGIERFLPTFIAAAMKKDKGIDMYLVFFKLLRRANNPEERSEVLKRIEEVLEQMSLDEASTAKKYLSEILQHPLLKE